jgi:predicted small metal-binding protein
MVMSEAEYYMFCCRDGPFKPCGFQVQAKTKEEAIEHVKAHAEKAHGMKEMGKEAEEKIKGAIKQVKAEE